MKSRIRIILSLLLAFSIISSTAIFAADTYDLASETYQYEAGSYLLKEESSESEEESYLTEAEDELDHPEMVLSANKGLSIYTQEISSGALNFADEAFDSLLQTAIQSNSMNMGSQTSLGTPFTIQNTEVQVYYFPVISDGAIIGSLRIWHDDIRYTGMLSQYLAQELNAVLRRRDVSGAISLYYDNGNLMMQANSNVEILSPSPLGDDPELFGFEVNSRDFREISPLEITTSEITRNQISTRNVQQRFLPVHILETQGNNSWCGAFATSMVIRHRLNNRLAPNVNSLMTDANPNGFNIHTRFSQQNTLDAARRRGFNPTWSRNSLPMNSVITDINNNRAIYFIANNPQVGGHAMVIRGYSSTPNQQSLNQYSIWNPWEPFFDIMMANTNQVVLRGRVYTWSETIHRW